MRTNLNKHGRWVAPVTALAAALVAAVLARTPVEAAASVNIVRSGGPITVCPGQGLQWSFGATQTGSLASPTTVTLAFRNANGGALIDTTDVQITGGCAFSRLEINDIGQINVDGEAHGGTGGGSLPIIVEARIRVPKNVVVGGSAQLIDLNTDPPKSLIGLLVP